MSRRSGVAAAIALAAILVPIGAHASADDKISTDRPDFVESSNVVGSGQVQVETSVAVERNRRTRERTASTPTLLRYGIGDAFELRLETDGLLDVRGSEAGSIVRERGAADTSIGVKWHALDENGLTPSLGVLLHADLPSGAVRVAGRGVRPSLRIAAEWELPGELSLGVMPGISAQTNADGAHHASAILGVVLGKSWTEKLRSFVELSAPQIARARNDGTIATFDVGAAYLLSDRCQIDSAFSRGLNQRTADFSWTVGLSFKL